MSLNKILQLRTALLSPLSPTKILTQGRNKKLPVSRAHQLLSYYPPDINLLAFSKLDPELANLPLKDVWYETRLAKEMAMEERGKPVRVSVKGGQKRDVGEKTKKKKRK